MTELKITEKSFLNSLAAVSSCGSSVFFSDRNYKALYEVDLKEKKTTICGVFASGESHGLAATINQKLWWFPESNRGTNIDIYDIKEKSFDTVPIEPETQLEENRRFSQILYGDEYIFALPCVGSKWIKIDRKTEQIEYFPVPEDKRNIIFMNAAMDENHIYLCARNPLSVYSIDDTGKWEIVYRDSTFDCFFESILIEDNYIYIIPRSISKPWIKMDKSGTLIERMEFNIDNDSDYFARTQIDKYLYFMPYDGKTGYQVDIKNKRVEEIKLNDNENRGDYYYWSAVSCDFGSVIYPLNGDAPLLLINGDGHIEEIGSSKSNRELQVLMSMIGVDIDV